MCSVYWQRYLHSWYEAVNIIQEAKNLLITQKVGFSEEKWSLESDIQ